VPSQLHVAPGKALSLHLALHAPHPTGAFTVTLSASRGILHLKRAGGLHVSGDGSRALRLVGTLAQLNFALGGLLFLPGDIPGSARLTLSAVGHGGKVQQPFKVLVT
jgi:hypothetical protein